MDKYKIKIILNEKQDINDILIKVLNKELKKYIQKICKNNKSEVPSSRVQFSLEEGKNC